MNLFEIADKYQGHEKAVQINTTLVAMDAAVRAFHTAASRMEQSLAEAQQRLADGGRVVFGSYVVNPQTAADLERAATTIALLTDSLVMLGVDVADVASLQRNV